MLVTEFKNRFLLQRAGAPHAAPPSAARTLKHSAVLVPVIDHGDQLSLLFTQRSRHLRHHPGQISFPGGKLEPNETAMAAALRETEEEIGISAHHISLLGALPAHTTLTGFYIRPWVGILADNTPLRLNTNEVSDVFTVPLDYFRQPSNRHQLVLPWRGQVRQVHIMPYQNKLIWGATAAIIAQLLQQLD